MTNIYNSVVAKNLSKKYRLFGDSRDRLKEIFHPKSKQYHKEFIALNSLSFTIKKGETFGILGKNGSGKSTLLQIISGILKPTSGELTVIGRISTLLELGAGFNPQYTGRQNCVFQAQMMGVSKAEIELKLPEIEAFADIGEFFDQPVKVYSTGMFVRVAFAVATSVEPDLLIIDEALSVGDASFQEKCFRRLRYFKSMGKTIIFVSHSLDSITDLCDRAMILHDQKIFAEGEPREIVDKYLKLILSPENTKDLDCSSAKYTEQPIKNIISNDTFFNKRNYTDMSGTRVGYNSNESIVSRGGASIIDFHIASSNGGIETLKSGMEITLYIKVLYKKNIHLPMIGFEIKNLSGIKIYATNSFISRDTVNSAKVGDIVIYSYCFKIPFNSGDYFIDLGVAETDGTEGGVLLELRKSIIHFIIGSAIDHNFNGLINLMPSFSEESNLSES